MGGAGNELVQIAHHLTTIADADRERILAREERREHVAGTGSEQDGFRPAFAGAKHIAVRKAASCREALIALERVAPRKYVRHVHVERIEACARESRSELDLAIYALLAQDR